MTKILLSLALTVTMYAKCTNNQLQEALEIWRSSIHQEDTQKLLLLTQAEKLCPTLDVIKVDKKIIETKNNLNLESLETLKNLNNTLRVPPSEEVHKWNNERTIDQLWLVYYQQQKSQKGFMYSQLASIQKNIDRLEKQQKFINTNNAKAVTDIGGYYKADLLFDKNSFKIKNITLTQDIIKVIHTEIETDANTLFGLAGGASSEGTAQYNKNLSKQRAKALKKAILKAYPQYTKNLKIFADGEEQLVCKGGLLPEKNTQGEYQCITKEDKEKSRRVTIRRVR